MARKRTATGLSAILALDKPEGMTSHDVVNVVRRITGERRVGHAGTLDPSATGLLLVCVGPATRLSDYLMVGSKVYEVRIRFGQETTTDDTEGEICRVSEIPSNMDNPDFARSFLAKCRGEIEQLPPQFSAIKKDGVTAYKAARAGKQLTLEPRKVKVYQADLLASGKDYWDVELTVSKGFYVRSFARDTGRELGSAAHVESLRRTASGCVSVGQASPLVALTSVEQLPCLDPSEALCLPRVELDAAEISLVRNGSTLHITPERVVACQIPSSHSMVPRNENLVGVVYQRRLLALYEFAGRSSMARPKVVIPGGVSYANE